MNNVLLSSTTVKLNKNRRLFYRTIWLQIKNRLINNLNEGYQQGQLSYTQKQSIISLIFKKGDPENLEN